MPDYSYSLTFQRETPNSSKRTGHKRSSLVNVVTGSHSKKRSKKRKKQLDVDRRGQSNESFRELDKSFRELVDDDDDDDDDEDDYSEIYDENERRIFGRKKGVGKV